MQHFPYWDSLYPLVQQAISIIYFVLGQQSKAPQIKSGAETIPYNQS